MRFVFLSMLLMVGVANAETDILLGAWSQHIPSDEVYNQTHDVIAVQHRNVLVGFFVNSYHDDTFALGYKWSKFYGSVEAGVYVGASYGYRQCLGVWSPRSSRKLCPMTVPFVTIDLGVLNPQVYLVGNALAMGFRLDIGKF